MSLPDLQSNSKSKQTPTATFPQSSSSSSSTSIFLLKILYIYTYIYIPLSLFLSLFLFFSPLSKITIKMKHFMQQKNSILRENQDPPLSLSTKYWSHNRKQKLLKDNAPPSNSNLISDLSASLAGGRGKLSPVMAKLKSLLPPRPLKNSNKLNLDNVLDNWVTVGSSDSGIQVCMWF